MKTTTQDLDFIPNTKENKQDAESNPNVDIKPTFHQRKRNLKILLSLALFLTLGIGGISAFLLSQNSLDLRQRASQGNISCTGITPTCPEGFTCSSKGEEPGVCQPESKPVENSNADECSKQNPCAEGYRCETRFSEPSYCKPIELEAQARGASVEVMNPISFSPNAKTVNVISLAYFPVKDGKLDTVNVIKDDFNEFDMTITEARTKVDELNTSTKYAAEQATSFQGYRTNAPSYLRFNIVDKKEFLEALPLSSRTYSNMPIIDYFAIANRINLCDLVDNKNVREVWLWSYGGTGLSGWESNFAGKYGDISNSDRFEDDLPKCKYSYTFYTFNYSKKRGAESSMHSRSHQYERIFRWIDEELFWGKYVGYFPPTPWSSPTTTDTRRRCGTTHVPPNATVSYQYKLSENVDSDCENWNPNGITNPQTINCSRWGCRELGYHIWWMQNMPGEANRYTYQSKKLRNWWDFVADFDSAMEKGKTLVSDEVVLQPTPSCTLTVNGQLATGQTIRVPSATSPISIRGQTEVSNSMVGLSISPVRITNGWLPEPNRPTAKESVQLNWRPTEPGSYYIVCNNITNGGATQGGSQCSGNPWCEGNKCSPWLDCGAADKMIVEVIASPPTATPAPITPPTPTSAPVTPTPHPIRISNLKGKVELLPSARLQFSGMVSPTIAIESWIYEIATNQAFSGYVERINQKVNASSPSPSFSLSRPLSTANPFKCQQQIFWRVTGFSANRIIVQSPVQRGTVLCTGGIRP